MDVPKQIARRAYTAFANGGPLSDCAGGVRRDQRLADNGDARYADAATCQTLSRRPRRPRYE